MRMTKEVSKRVAAMLGCIDIPPTCIGWYHEWTVCLFVIWFVTNKRMLSEKEEKMK
jgi:hypothetical protein